MEKSYVCLDAGGTEIKAARVSGAGEILSPVRHFPAKADADAESILENMARVICETAESGPAAGIRFAFPGPFDYENGICLIRGLAKYGSLYGVNLRERTAALTGMPGERIRFCNDADAFALGEIHFGAAAGAGRAMFVCIGTGCGSAFAINGRLAKSGPYVPEQGYIYSTPFLENCIDDYISRRGLTALSQQETGRALDGKALAGLAGTGDAAARRCFGIFGERLRDALTPFLTTFRPEVLCLGGQIMKSAELFTGPLRDRCGELGISVRICPDTSASALKGLTVL